MRQSVPNIQFEGQGESSAPLPKQRFYLHKEYKALLRVVKWRAKDGKGNRMVHLMPADKDSKFVSPIKVYIKELKEQYHPVDEKVAKVLYGAQSTDEGRQNPCAEIFLPSSLKGITFSLAISKPQYHIRLGDVTYWSVD
jgi:hypothetical protein